MNTVYLICFVLGLTLSLLAVFGGTGRFHLHIGHTHGVHVRAGHTGGLSAFNGFTLPAFLCWFGGAGYLLRNYSPLMMPLVLAGAVACGLVGASLLYAALFKFLLPNERVMLEEDTRMEGVVGRVSNAIRAEGGTGEILFTQLETRRSAAARSDTGTAIERGTEVVVLRYDRGIAYVAPLDRHLL